MTKKKEHGHWRYTESGVSHGCGIVQFFEGPFDLGWHVVRGERACNSICILIEMRLVVFMALMFPFSLSI